MSEFIAACPKCRQQILCDTVYIGKRIACPLCMQEIQMPEPARQGGQADANQRGPASQQPETAGAGKGSGFLVPAVVGVIVVVLVIAVVALALRKPAVVASPAPASVQTASAAATPAPVPVQASAVTTVVPAPKPVSPPVPTAKTVLIPQELLGQCRAIWTFDQDSGGTVLDSTGNGYNGKLQGESAVWVKAESSDSTGLSMDGSDCMEVAAPVVNTAQSFSVSAWVKLDVMEAKKPQTIVSIDGATNSGFALGFFPFSGSTARGGRFELSRAENDSKDATVVRALTKYGVNSKTWYNVAGVCDAKTKTISLYLNGILQTNMPCPGFWQATGKTVVGRGLWSGHPAHYMQGIVRDVRLYAAALTEEQIKEIAR